MSDANAKALLHFNGDNNAVYIDDFGSTKIWTAGGTAKLITSVKKLGRSSLYLDGDTGYISTPDHADFTLGTSAFSFDFWIRFPVLPTITPQCIFCKYQDASNKYYLEIYDNSGTQTIRFRSREGGSIVNDVSFPVVGLATETWYHFEFSQSGGIFYLFQNGILISSVAGAIELADLTGAFEIGRNGTSGYLNAYIDEFRYTNGAARHTTDFVNKTVGYKRIGVDDEYTSFLCHFSGVNASAITDESVCAALTGPAVHSTAAFKFSPSSALCNGTTQYVGVTTPRPRHSIWHRQYATIDTWVNFTDITAHAMTIMFWQNAAYVLQLNYNQTVGLHKFTLLGSGVGSADIVLTADLNTGQWYHFAFVKNAATLTAYVDGVLVGSVDIAAVIVNFDTLAEYANTYCWIGGVSGGSSYAHAYFDEFRISPDIQRWTEGFVVPTSEYGAPVQVAFTGTIAIPLTIYGALVKGFPGDIAATLSIPISIGGALLANHLMGSIAITPVIGGTISYDPRYTINASLPIPISISGTMKAMQFVEAPGLDVVIPALEFQGSGIIGEFGYLSVIIPSLKFSGNGETDEIGNLAVTLPRLSFRATAEVSEIGNLAVTLPMLKFAMTLVEESSGTLAVTIPMLRINFTGGISETGNLAVTLPMLLMSFFMESQSYLNMVMNIKNRALTLYANYPFNSLCRFNGKHLGMTENRIYDLDSGETDDGTLIDWNFRTAYVDLDQKIKLKLKQVWFSYKSNGDLIVTVVQPDGTEYEYDLTGYEITEDGLRVKFGKGLGAKYVALDVKNVDGSSMVLDTLRLNFDKFKKER